MAASPNAKKALVTELDDTLPAGERDSPVDTPTTGSLSSSEEPPPKYEEMEFACSDALLQQKQNGDAVKIDIPLNDDEDDGKYIFSKFNLLLECTVRSI